MNLSLPLEVREYRPEDAAAALALRNAVLPPIGPQHWPQSQTAAVAVLDGLLDVYRAYYAQCAGPPPRRTGYWRQALAAQMLLYYAAEGRFEKKEVTSPMTLVARASA